MTKANFDAKRMFRAAVIGGAIAGVVNVALFFLGSSLGASYIMTMAGQPPQPIPPFMPMVNSVMAGVVGAGLLIGLRKLAPAKVMPVFFAICALVFALFTFLAFRALPADTTGMMMLQLMHVVTAVGVLGAMRKAM